MSNYSEKMSKHIKYVEILQATKRGLQNVSIDFPSQRWIFVFIIVEKIRLIKKERVDRTK